MVDLSQTSTNVQWNSGTAAKTAIAGEALTAGQPVYISSSDGKLYRADADDTAAKAAAVGIALVTTAAGNLASYAPPGANLDIGATTTQGTIYAVSASVGAIAPEADLTTNDYVTILFVGSGSADVTLLDGVSGVQHV